MSDHLKKVCEWGLSHPRAFHNCWQCQCVSSDMLICAATNKMKYKSVVTTYKLSRNHYHGNTLPWHKPEKTKKNAKLFLWIQGNCTQMYSSHSQTSDKCLYYECTASMIQCTIHSFIIIQPWRPGLAGTRAQSCDQYGSGTLHSGQVLGGSLPLLSPAFTRSHFSCQVPPSATTREILAVKGGTVGEKDVR